MTEVEELVHQLVSLHEILYSLIGADGQASRRMAAMLPDKVPAQHARVDYGKEERSLPVEKAGNSKPAVAVAVDAEAADAGSEGGGSFGACGLGAGGAT